VKWLWEWLGRWDKTYTEASDQKINTSP